MEHTFFVVASVLFGACIGSFLNVVILRVPHRTFFKGGQRSHCPKCGASIAWFDNIPIVSWVILLRGKGRCCGNPISIRYPLVEALTAAMLGLLFWYHFPDTVALEAGSGGAWLAFALEAYFLAVLIACTFIDIDHRILPDVLTKPTMVVGLLGALLVPGLAAWYGAAPVDDDRFGSLLQSLAGLVTGYALTASVRNVASKAFGREAMGYGDVKFMAAIGAFVGFDGVLVTFFAGSLFGAIYGGLHQWITKEGQIFFGPFLAMGAVLALFVKDPIVHFITVTWPQYQQTADFPPWVLGAVAVVCALALVLLVRRARRRVQG